MCRDEVTKRESAIVDKLSDLVAAVEKNDDDEDEYASEDEQEEVIEGDTECVEEEEQEEEEGMTGFIHQRMPWNQSLNNRNNDDAIARNVIDINNAVSSANNDSKITSFTSQGTSMDKRSIETIVLHSSTSNQPHSESYSVEPAHQINEDRDKNQIFLGGEGSADVYVCPNNIDRDEFSQKNTPMNTQSAHQNNDVKLVANDYDNDIDMELLELLDAVERNYKNKSCNMMHLHVEHNTYTHCMVDNYSSDINLNKENVTDNIVSSGDIAVSIDNPRVDCKNVSILNLEDLTTNLKNMEYCKGNNDHNIKNTDSDSKEIEVCKNTIDEDNNSDGNNSNLLQSYLFNDTVTSCNNSNHKSNYINIFKCETSPFLTPFTPSKRATPGKYLYLREFNPHQHQHQHHNNQIMKKRSNDICIPSQAFGWRYISNYNDCDYFLMELSKASCVSFELMYRQIPLMNGSDIDAVIKKWKPFITQFNPNLSHDHGHSNNNNNSSTSKYNSKSLPQVLVGIGICFGNEYGYYIPLPTPLPLPTFPFTTYLEHNDQNSLHKSSYNSNDKLMLSSLPHKCVVMVSRFIGYESILGKCKRLAEKMINNKIKTNKFHKSFIDDIKHNDNIISDHSDMKSTSTSTYLSENQSFTRNPLLISSKSLSLAAREGLYIEWMRGRCAEWRILSEIFSNPFITKVSINMKSKILALRERDIITNGDLEDPYIAIQLLHGIDNIPNISKLLTIPNIPYDQNIRNKRERNGNVINNDNNNSDLYELCYRKRSIAFQSISIMRTMSELTPLLKQYSLYNLFHSIEMPLCLSVANAEFSGISTDIRYFTKLRQDLYDRQKTIEYYFQLIKGKDFQLTSTIHCNQLKIDIINMLKSRNQNFNNINNNNNNNNCNNNNTTSHVINNRYSSVSLKALDISNHPLMKLLSEWRSHSRMIPLCHSILNAKFRFIGTTIDRVRASFNAQGTDTGRLIVSNPPLQQVPHECTFWLTSRPTIHDEMAAYQRGDNNNNSYNSNISNYINAMNKKFHNGRNVEWVRMTSLKSLQTTRDVEVENSFSQHDMNMENDKNKRMKVSSGKLISISHKTINQPYARNNVSSTNNLKQLTNNNNINSNDHNGEDLSKSLMDIWNEAGMNYTREQGDKIHQVLVDVNGCSYCYPADQVVRLLAPLRPNTVEILVLNEQLNGEVEKWITNTDKSQPQHPDYQVLNPRDGFRAPKGYVFLSADYSQIELRIMAHLSKDSKLLEAFHRDDDVFRSLAAGWKKKLETDISTDERNNVKQMCYAFLYGAGK